MIVVKPARRLRGELRVPGDKSISHRALMLNAIAEGEATVSNLGPGADCLSTLRCLRALGVTIETLGDGALRVVGVGLQGLREPEDLLDAGNSGTAMRLLAGLLAGQPFLSILTGDSSLRSRPMRRVIEPLRRMGAQLWARRDDSLPPIAVRGGFLKGIEYNLPVASAQLKSALLLAGLCAEGPTVLREPQPSRDHTERMLAAQGARISPAGGAITLTPGDPLTVLSVQVPGDISSAAFWLVAAAVHPDAEITVRDVGINPGRTGVLEVLRAMGADLEVVPRGERGGEPVADLVARSSHLRGAQVGGALIPRLIDEIPVLAVAAAFAEGETRFSDAAELRVKETDRVRAMSTELARLGADVQELADGLVVRGGRSLRGDRCLSYGDHRMAMAMAVAGLVAQGETAIEGAEVAEISYPSFWEDLERLSAGGRA
ncbi:MAG: 3-phosphoshikimate 1-carboxyvinyltransferase [Actinobacteria bacterium]|nr:3-phosphoshikimate 1-carboxyvinyltransferase [Actinomycetota bacterium]